MHPWTYISGPELSGQRIIWVILSHRACSMTFPASFHCGHNFPVYSSSCSQSWSPVYEVRPLIEYLSILVGYLGFFFLVISGFYHRPTYLALLYWYLMFLHMSEFYLPLYMWHAGLSVNIIAFSAWFIMSLSAVKFSPLIGVLVFHVLTSVNLSLLLFEFFFVLVFRLFQMLKPIRWNFHETKYIFIFWKHIYSRDWLTQEGTKVVGAASPMRQGSLSRDTAEMRV